VKVSPASAPLALFDFDGTIADSALGIVRCMEHAFGALHVPMPPSTENMIGPPLAIMFERAGLPSALTAEAIRLYRARYDDVGVFEATVYDGVRPMLSALAAAGVRMAVATSKQEPAARRMLEHFELTSSFEFIGGASLDGSRSAKADVIAYVLDAVGAVGPGAGAGGGWVTMVGDRHHDVHGALAHGLACIGVTWGYGTAEELSTAGATLVVDHPSALVPALFDDVGPLHVCG
jgi:phosphoglycolate phosphatase